MNRRIGDLNIAKKKTFQLNIRSIEPNNPISVKHGDSGKMQIVIKNGFLSGPKVVVSLGQGIKTKVISARPDRKLCTSTLILSYRVEPHAEFGQRVLLIQFNRIFLDKCNVLWVLEGQIPD